MTLPITSLDIPRPPRHAVRLGKRWQEIAAAPQLDPARIGLHVRHATLNTRAPRKRPRRLWRYVAVAYLTPAGAALSVVAALWILRHGL